MVNEYLLFLATTFIKIIDVYKPHRSGPQPKLPLGPGWVDDLLIGYSGSDGRCQDSSDDIGLGKAGLRDSTRGIKGRVVRTAAIPDIKLGSLGCVLLGQNRKFSASPSIGET